MQKTYFTFVTRALFKLVFLHLKCEGRGHIRGSKVKIVSSKAKICGGICVIWTHFWFVSSYWLLGLRCQSLLLTTIPHHEITAKSFYSVGMLFRGLMMIDMFVDNLIRGFSNEIHIFWFKLTFRWDLIISRGLSYPWNTRHKMSNE